MDRRLKKRPCGSAVELTSLVSLLVVVVVVAATMLDAVSADAQRLADDEADGGRAAVARSVIGETTPRLVVVTEQGAVMGRRETKDLKIPFLAFRGIPYAAPPVGDLRFQSPQAHPRWTGIKMTLEYRRSCLSYLYRLILGDEDCLYLNVFVPEVSPGPDGSRKPLPVVFWLHGGGLIQGSEVTPFLYHPRTFTDKGVIFVSLNYRLGPLGFLSMDDAVLPGNYGFKDMVMALKWIKRNIRSFGGDPEQVHLMGQSSGGMAVHALSLSPMTKGMFQTAIAMSGTLFMMSSLNPRGRPMANHLARHLECPTDDSQRMLACFRQRGAKELTLGIKEFFFVGLRYGTPFAAVIDSYAADPFLPQHPLQLIRDGKTEQIPFIFGSMPFEMNMFLPGILYDPLSYDLITNNWDDECGRLAYPFLYFQPVIPDREDTVMMCKRAKAEYFEDGQMDPDGTARKMATFAGDMFIRVGTYAAALLQAKHSSAPVYYYSVDHVKEGPLGFVNLMNKLADDHLHMVYTNATRLTKLRLAPDRAHTDDLFILFDPPGLQDMPPNDVLVKESMAAAFSSFWSSGTPTVPGADWPRFRNDTQLYLSFAAPPRVGRRLIARERLRLFADWLDLHQMKSVGEAPPSLSEMLGLGRPDFMPPPPSPAADSTAENVVSGGGGRRRSVETADPPDDDGGGDRRTRARKDRGDRHSLVHTSLGNDGKFIADAFTSPPGDFFLADRAARADRAAALRPLFVGLGAAQRPFFVHQQMSPPSRTRGMLRRLAARMTPPPPPAPSGPPAARIRGDLRFAMPRRSGRSLLRRPQMGRRAASFRNRRIL